MCRIVDLRQTRPTDAMLLHGCEGQMERLHDEVDRPCFCVDTGVIRAGYATRTAPTAGQDGHHCPRSMWSGHAHGEWYVRENSRPPCRQQVRSRSDLLESAANRHVCLWQILLQKSVEALPGQ